MAVASPGWTSTLAGRRRVSLLGHLDVALVGAVLAIASLGVVMVYSATRSRLEASGRDPRAFLERQAAWVVAGLIVMAVVAAVDYRIYRRLALVLYLGTVAALGLVLSPLGSESRGAQAWFQLGSLQLQPSEYAKIGLIVLVAALAGSERGQLDGSRLVMVLLAAGVPVALVYLQPDLGTALVFVAIVMVMIVVAGARLLHIGLLALLGLAAVVAVLRLGVLEQYQLDRLGAFLDPQDESQRSTYNLNQSKIAVGAGGLLGKGLFEGTQTKLAYVPEQHTDFIFTVVGEETGFVGSSLLLSLFAIVVWRTWRAANLAGDPAGTLICSGVLALVVFQVFQNVGMTIGIMPITGIPLPFMSYGGSSTLAGFIAVGLVLNVNMRRFR